MNTVHGLAIIDFTIKTKIRPEKSDLINTFSFPQNAGKVQKIIKNFSCTLFLLLDNPV